MEPPAPEPSEPTPPARRSRRICGILLAQAVGLLLLGGVGEVLVRWCSPGFVFRGGTERNFFCRFDPLLGWRGKSDFLGVHERDGFAIEVRQNAAGFRGSAALRGPSTERRIMVLGDSYVWGYGVRDEEVFTEPGAHRSEGLALINLGVSGYGTDQELLLYRSMRQSVDANEVVLVLTPYNDFADNSGPRAYGHVKPHFTLDGQGRPELHAGHVQPNRLREWRDGLRFSSALLNLLDSRMRVEKDHDRGLRRLASDPIDRILPPGPVGQADQTLVALTAALLDELRREVELDGRKFTVIFVPFKPHVLTDTPHNHPLVEALAAKLQERAIDYLDPYVEFLAAQSPENSLFNPIDNHFSPRGHREFARLFSDGTYAEGCRNVYAR